MQESKVIDVMEAIRNKPAHDLTPEHLLAMAGRLDAAEYEDAGVVAELWEKLKFAEDSAKNLRKVVEAHLLEKCGHETEGSTRFDFDGWRITTTGKMDRKVNYVLLQENFKSLSPEAKRCFRFSASVDKKHFDVLRENSKEEFFQISQVITEKPGNATIKIERKD